MTKTIVITGAGEGLGKALARRFAADGHAVVLLGRTLAKLEAAAAEFGGNAMAVQCDVGDPGSVRPAFATIAQAHPAIDVLINNAAVYAPFTLAEASDEQVMAQITTNIAGPIFVTREAASMMGPGGHIINVTSEGVDVRMPMLWCYAGTKAALERIGQGWADELRGAGIRVTTIRAGKMFGEGKTSSGWDMELTMRFATACAEAGMPLFEQPLSNYDSVLDIFCTVIASAPDINLDLVTLGGRRAG